MAKLKSKSQPTWTDVKAKLAGFDRAELLGLVRDLYDAHRDNQAFLHARFGLGADVLKPYKETLDRWLWPDVLRNQNASVAKAKQAVSSYRKAVGEPAGLAELMVFYFDALARMFEQALVVADRLSANRRNSLIARLDRVRAISHNFGYGVGDHID